MSGYDPTSSRASTAATVLFQSAPVIMLLVHSETTAIVEANERAIAFYGWDADVFLTMSLSGITAVSPDDVSREMARAMEESRDFYESFHRTARGTVVPVDVFRGPVTGTDPYGSESLQLTIVHDATEKHNARREYARLLKMQEQTLTAINGLVTVLDREFNILYSNWHGYENNAERRRHGTPQCFAVFYHRRSKCPWCPIPQVFLTGKPLTKIMDNLPDNRIRLISAVPIPGDDRQIEMVVEHVQDITESVHNREALAREVKHNEALIREVYHRVKNNLQVISSIIDLTARSTTSPEARETLRDTRNRIYTMALVHQSLYQSEEIEYVRIDDYLEHLMADLRRSLDRTDCRVTFDLAITRLSLAQGVPVAQIAGELITNALRYGHSRIRISLARRDAAAEGSTPPVSEPPVAELTVEDDGPGYPGAPGSTPGVHTHTHTHTQTLGLVLVEALTDQLHGRFLRERSSHLHGARGRVLFPLDDGAPDLQDRQ